MSGAQALVSCGEGRTAPAFAERRVSAQRVEGSEDVGRFGAGGVVGVDEGPADGAVAVDDVGGGQWQRARVTVVDALEVEAELVVDGGEVVGEVEGEAVLLGSVGADVAEDVEVEGVLRGEGEGLVGDLRGDGDEAGVARWRQSLRTVLGSTR